MFSVAVVVTPGLLPGCPHLLFRGAACPDEAPLALDSRDGSREVPLCH
jgi:hypothetical protein